MTEFVDDFDAPQQKDNIIDSTQSASAFVGAESSEIEERKAAARAALASMNDIIQTTSPESLSNDAPKFSKPKANKRTTKPELVASVCKLQDELDVEKRPRSHFERMNKKELEEYLAWLVNESVNKLNDVLPEDAQEIRNKSPEVSGELDGAKASRIAASRSKQIELGAKALFQFNMILCKVAELGSVNFQEKLGTNLEGLTEDVLKNREQLEEILAQIYAEHSETLKEYISPLNQYFLLMTSLSANRALANKAKVEEELKKR
jgi:hypothetical protein